MTGLTAGVTASFIDIWHYWLVDLRLGYCKTSWAFNTEFCCWASGAQPSSLVFALAFCRARMRREWADRPRGVGRRRAPPVLRRQRRGRHGLCPMDVLERGLRA